MQRFCTSHPSEAEHIFLALKNAYRNHVLNFRDIREEICDRVAQAYAARKITWHQWKRLTKWYVILVERTKKGAN